LHFQKGPCFNCEVFCRFIELYNEEFYDLLSHRQQKLSIRSDSKSVQLLGVSEHRVQSCTDMLRVLEIGWEARHTAETAMSRESSRSHCIFSVKTEELVNNIVNKRCATLNLVDLAGSERQTQSNAFGERFKEAININSVNGFLNCGHDSDIDYYLFQSLVVLGRVIRTLSDVNRRGEHIPYRDSKLTHILRDSLGGNSRTAVIVNVHPDIGYYSDTISTLQFAADCRKIENRVCANEDLAADTVMAYKSEIARLREELRLVEEKTRSEVGSKMSALQDELKNWKEAAILREKALAKAQIQCDLLNAQLMSQTDQGASTQLHDEVVSDILSQLWRRIESVNTLEELTEVQLQNDLSNARSELDQLQRRCESAEASRKALNEKYKNLLEKCNETFFGSPPRHLNLNTTPERGKNAKSAAQRREKRRQSFYVPALGNHDSASLVFRPVLFEENEESGSQLQGDIEHDEDVIEKRRLLLLEMDNNRLSQVVLEKEAALKDICDKQKTQSKQWLEEKMLFVQNESLLSARIEGLQVEKQALLEEVKKLQEQKERLSTSISSCNDEKCRLEQSVKSLRSEKLDLEDKLQGMQNENERLLTELRSKPELVS
ncbi:hypothetical protein Angca_008232, partial [Angiostrongylus cantonensis]